VKEVKFVGRLILPEAELKAKMKTKENQVYIPILLEEDVLVLKEIYDSLDYNRAEVEVAAVDFKEKRKVYITLKIVAHEKMEIVVRGAKVPLNLLQPIWEERIFEEWGLTEGEANHL